MKGFLEELAWRGLIQDQTPGFAARLAKGPITGYVGFDPTAPSLQVGNLVPIMLLAHLQRAGGTPIVVVGGGTGRIGDPSGKRGERPLLDEATLAANVARQRDQLARFLDVGRGANAARLVDNLEWLGGLNLIGFLRDIGKHFTVGWMLQKESVRARLEAGISYTEFSYMLLQAYDFLELYRRHRCELQLGGSDQWGNITAGIELVRRLEGVEVHGLTAPLIATASGAKFGKSEGEAVWLDPAMTSPYRFYQFWLNSDDRDVERYLKFFSFRSKQDVAALMTQHAASAGERIPHRALADELTERVHGPDAARGAAEASRVVFGDLTPREAGGETWRALARELPSAPLNSLGPGSPVVDLLVAAGVVKSKTEARRQIEQGGITVNGEKVTDAAATVPAPLAGGYYFVSRGKKTHALMTPPS